MDRYAATERQHSTAVRRSADAAQADHADAHPLLQLQRQVGNAQIARMLAQRQGAPEEEELQMARLQRQGSEEEEIQMDRLERQEEDEEVQMVRLQRHAAPGDEANVPIMEQRLQRQEEDEEVQMSRLQRQEEPEEDEMQMERLQREGEEDEEIQMARGDAQREPEVGLAGGPISAGLSDRISSQRGGGAPLDHGTRSAMETNFDTSFEDVRVHSGSESAALNRSIAGRAFTTGNDIFLGESASASDSGLMAHELTHVVQQRSMTGSGGPMTVTAAGDQHEQEADAAAAAITSGQPAAHAAQRDHDD
ncbi:MAG: DUF4157 domain-containing protein [Chloroflexi bacterium]|nr:DUF4157 domain-containing protein [Chloroflexota bacterium]